MTSERGKQMETVRVWEVARRLERSSADVLAALQSAGHDVTTATSSVPVTAIEDLTGVVEGEAKAGPVSDAGLVKRRSKKRVDRAGVGASATDTGQSTAAAAGVGAGANVPAKLPSAKPVWVEPVLIDEGLVEGLVEELLEGFRLVRKGSVTVGSVRVVKGGVVSVSTFEGLPARVQAWFDPILSVDDSLRSESGSR